MLAEMIQKQTGIETARRFWGTSSAGGAPSAYDRILATRLGLAASRLVLQKRFGMMVTLMGGQIVDTPMSESAVVTKTLDLNYYNEAAAFFY